MPPKSSSFRSPVALLGLAAVFAFAPSAHAVLVNTWTLTAGTAANTSGLNSASPVFGTGAAGTGNNLQAYGTTPTYTLGSVGDSVVFSGTAVFTLSAGAGSDQFRFGLFDTNGSGTTNGWLGYFGTNSGSGGNWTGRLWERKAGNTAAYFNNSTSADERQSFAGTPASTASVSTFVGGTYNFSMAATRTEAGLSVVWSIVGGTNSYSIGGTYNDTTALTYTFNRVGFFTGGGLNANQVSFSNVDLTFTAAAVPEPSSFALLAGLAGAGLVAGRPRSRWYF